MIYEDIFDGSLEIDPQLQPDQLVSFLRELPACKGVVLFADQDNRPVQLLIAGDIRRTARASLCTEQVETLSKRPEITSIVRYIFYKCCYNDFAAALAHYRAAKDLWPNNYPDKLSLSKLALVKIRPSDNWPAFSVVSSPVVSNDEIIFGPFQSRKSAAEFVNSLENAFMLCHRLELASNRQKAVSCPYLQMENCPGPCVGNIPMEQYYLQIRDAISAASGESESIKIRLQEEMQSLGGELKFEEANKIKARMEQLSMLERYQYKWTTRLTDLAVVHLDISSKVKIKGKRKKIQTFSAFLMSGSQVREFSAFSIEDIESFHNELIDQINSTSMSSGTEDRKTKAEQLSLLCSFLYRTKPSGLWMNCSKGSAQMPDAEELKFMIQKKFELED